MQITADKTLEIISKDFNLSKEEILKEGLKYFLERRLREIRSEIYRITGKYNISSVEEFETLYREGKIEEKDSLTDFQKLDHLEFKKEEIERLLHEMQ
jgi:hypothetical protein